MELTKTKFKQTEIGLIPENWNVEKLGEKFTIKNGLNKAKEYFGYGTPIVNYMDVFNNSGIRKSDVEGKVFVNYQEKENYKVKLGDLLFTRTSETPDEIGMSSVLLEEITDSVFSGFVLRARPKDETFNNQFKKYCFRSNEVRNQIISTCSYTTRALTNGKSLSAVLIPTPPLPEQKAIAQVLSDTDNLIQTIELKLTKKRAIKQGAMQQLLTPKEYWEVKKLGGIAHFYNGKAHEQFIDANGEFTVINSKFISRNATVFKNSTVNLCPLQKGDITMVMSDIPNGKALAKCFLVPKDDKYTLNQRICAIRADDDVYNIFLALILNRNKYYLSFDSGTGQTNLKKNDVLECPIPLPPTKKEQTEIATILSDMDAEIAQLVQKLSKYKMLKQGLMQNLLTGKIRLV